MVRPDRLSLTSGVRPGRGPPRTMPAPDGDTNSRSRGEPISGRHRLRAVQGEQDPPRRPRQAAAVVEPGPRAAQAGMVD